MELYSCVPYLFSMGLYGAGSGAGVSFVDSV